LRPAALDSTRYERFATYLAKEGVIGKRPALADYAVEVR
jgi:putative hydroxymethylpyrimidine transport system substrate-binding protein